MAELTVALPSSVNAKYTKPADGIPVTDLKKSDLDGLTKSDVRSIICLGDSITEGNQDGSGYRWPAMLGTALGANVSVVNAGKSGWTSTEIAARIGAIEFTLDGFTVPNSTAQTAVTVTAPTTDFRTSAELFPAWTGVLSFGSTRIAGTLRHTIHAAATVVNGWTFAATTAPGSTVAVPAGAKFVGTEYDAYRGSTVIVAAGRNNIRGGVTFDLNTLVADVAKVVDRLTPTVKRILVLGVTTKVNETSATADYAKVIAANNALAAIYGDRFLDVRRGMIDRGLAIAAISPTAGDTTAINGDTIPPSLMYTDQIHPNKYGYRAMATLILERLRALDWVKDAPSPIASITPPMAHRWRAADLAGADGSAAVPWTDSIGGKVLAQGTTAQQPTIITDGGVKYVRFDGVDDNLSLSTFNLDQPLTVIIKAKVNSLAATQGLVAAESGMSMSIATSGEPQIYGGSAVQGLGTPAVTVGSVFTIAGVLAGDGSAGISYNGGALSTGTGKGTAGIPWLRLGRVFDGATRYAQIDIAEVRFYKAVLSASDIAAEVAAM